jgi:hypothetical protein
MGYEAEEFKHCKVIDPKTNIEGKDSGDPLIECVHCLSRFSGGVFQIRGHILGIKSRGGGVCRSAPQDAKDYFQAIESKKLWVKSWIFV